MSVRSKKFGSGRSDTTLVEIRTGDIARLLFKTNRYVCRLIREGRLQLDERSPMESLWSLVEYLESKGLRPLE